MVKVKAEFNPETNSYSYPSACPTCKGAGLVQAPRCALATTFQPIGKCPTCKGTGAKS